MAASSQLALNRSLLPTGSRVAVAVSGGADSTALLLAMHQQQNDLGIGVTAVHLNHGIRGAEADADANFLRDLCHRLDVPLHLEAIDVPAQAAADHETVEEAARNARLRLFEQLMQQGMADLVATAHTQDDQAETVLMKLLRGAWTDGLGGIYPRVEIGHGAIIRPILHLSRADVEAFLRQQNQAWCEDSTNASPDYTRNRIRHTLMPLLREFNPQVAATLSATAELAREEEERANRDLQRLLPQILLPGKPVRGGGRAVQADENGLAFEIERLRTLDMPTRRRVLRAAAARLQVRLSSAETLRLLRLCGLQPETAPPDPTVSAKPGTRLTLSGGLLAERSPRELRLSRTWPRASSRAGNRSLESL